MRNIRETFSAFLVLWCRGAGRNEGTSNGGGLCDQCGEKALFGTPVEFVRDLSETKYYIAAKETRSGW